MATENNVYFDDDKTGKVSISTHVLFDETPLSVLDTFIPLGVKAL